MILKEWIPSLLVVGLILVSYQLNSAEKKFIEVRYYKFPYGHIHQNASKYSTSLTTLSCGHPVKVYQLKEKSNKDSLLILDQWLYVVVGPYEGYIDANHLTDKRPECIQNKYSKFFDELDLGITDFFYWGKLYDHFLFGKSKVDMKTP